MPITVSTTPARNQLLFPQSLGHLQTLSVMTFCFLSGHLLKYLKLQGQVQESGRIPRKVAVQ